MEWTSWYWWRMAATWHMLGDYAAELRITDRWRDSAAVEWQAIRGRALAALGREREVMALLASSAGGSVDSVASHQLTMATELAAHGQCSDGDGHCREHPGAVRARAGHRLEPRIRHRLGEPAARSDGARAGGARADRPERGGHARQAGSGGPDRGAAGRHRPGREDRQQSGRAEQPPFEEPLGPSCADPCPGSHRRRLRPPRTGRRPAPGCERSGHVRPGTPRTSITPTYCSRRSGAIRPSTRCSSRTTDRR